MRKENCKVNNISGKDVKTGLIAFLVLSIVAALGAGAMWYVINGNTVPETTHVEKIFVDIDRNGDDDLLMEGEVIFNKNGKSQLQFTDPADPKNQLTP
jgi:hypothetical protein